MREPTKFKGPTRDEHIDRVAGELARLVLEHVHDGGAPPAAEGEAVPPDDVAGSGGAAQNRGADPGLGAGRFAAGGGEDGPGPSKVDRR